MSFQTSAGSRRRPAYKVRPPDLILAVFVALIAGAASSVWTAHWLPEARENAREWRIVVDGVDYGPAGALEWRMCDEPEDVGQILVRSPGALVCSAPGPTWRQLGRKP